MIIQEIETFCNEKYKYIMFALALCSSILFFCIQLLLPLDLSTGSKDKVWLDLIENVSSGKGYKVCEESYIPNCKMTNQETALREPLPVLIYAMFVRIAGENPLILSIPQLMFNLAILFGVFWLAEEIGGKFMGLLAAISWALYLPVIRVEIHINGDLIAATCITYSSLMFVRAIKQGNLMNWIWFGFNSGLAIISRSSALVYVFSLLFGYFTYTLFMKKFITITLLKNLCISTLIMSVVVSPWVIRNKIVFGEPIIGTTLIGYNLFRHNAIVVGEIPPHYVGPEEAARLVQRLVVSHPELNTPINEAEVDRIFREEAIRLIKDNTGEYIELVLYRFLPLWFNIGVMSQYGNSMTVLDYIVVIQQFFLLASLLYVIWKAEWLTRLILVGLPLYLLSYMAVDSQLRYLLPVAPVIISVAVLSFRFSKLNTIYFNHSAESF